MQEKETIELGNDIHNMIMNAGIDAENAVKIAATFQKLGLSAIQAAVAIDTISRIDLPYSEADLLSISLTAKNTVREIEPNVPATRREIRELTGPDGKLKLLSTGPNRRQRHAAAKQKGSRQRFNNRKATDGRTKFRETGFIFNRLSKSPSHMGGVEAA